MATNLPSGTVTFLFTDIEGSTRLWQEQPEAMSIAHARHDAILRETIESNQDRKSTRLNSSHIQKSRMPSSA